MKSKHTDTRLRKLLGRMTDGAAAARLGLSVSACVYHRARLGIAPLREKSREWTQREIKLLGTMPDGQLAARLGCSRKHVVETRQRRGVAAYVRSELPS